MVMFSFLVLDRKYREIWYLDFPKFDDDVQFLGLGPQVFFLKNLVAIMKVITSFCLSRLI